jgi:hypothetical protein
MKLTSRSLVRIYLAKQDKVGKNRKGKEKHFPLDTQGMGAKKFKMAVLVQVYLCLLSLGNLT